MKICIDEKLLERIPETTLRDLGTITGKMLIEELAGRNLNIEEIEDRLNRDLEEIGVGKISILRQGRRGIVEISCEGESKVREFARGLVEAVVDHLFGYRYCRFENDGEKLLCIIESGNRDVENLWKKMEFLKRLWEYSFQARSEEPPPFPGEKFILPPFEKRETLEEFKKNIGIK